MTSRSERGKVIHIIVTKCNEKGRVANFPLISRDVIYG